MPNFASVLKDEIVRLARKEIRNELEGLRKAAARHRTEIAALKNRVAELEKRQSWTDRRVARMTPQAEPGAPPRLRFSAKRLAAQRKRLGLSAADMGALLGVSAQSVYHWETEKTRPRQAQLAAIAAVRKIGKREARARLESRKA